MNTTPGYVRAQYARYSPRTRQHPQPCPFHSQRIKYDLHNTQVSESSPLLSRARMKLSFRALCAITRSSFPEPFSGENGRCATRDAVTDFTGKSDHLRDRLQKVVTTYYYTETNLKEPITLARKVK